MSKGQETSLALRATCTDSNITIHLPAPGSYRIHRKSVEDKSWTTLLVNDRVLDKEFVDFNTVVGQSYEYNVVEIMKESTGYLLAGSKIPLRDNMGKLVLIVESTHAAALSKELDQFVADLVGDGYEVIVRRALKTDPPEYVKGIIKLEHDADPTNVKTVILFGAVPVKMSGPVNYDGHGDVMVAADGFYADMTGDWTGLPAVFPAKLDLIVGRIDFSDLTCYLNKPNNPRSELDLYRQYLNRNHKFRTRQWAVTPRGAIRDGFNDRDFSSNGWRNMPQLCRDGIAEISDGKFFAMASDFDYLAAFACGGGQLVSMAGVGDSNDFATNNIQVPLVMLLGSEMLGRWNSESNFVRSCLGSGDDEGGCLVAFGAGAPHVFLHRMGLGGTIGESFLLSENNFVVYPPTGNAEPGLYTPAESTGIPSCIAKVHQALFGDPTLGLYPVKPVTNLMGVATGSILHLGWDAPINNGDVVGYHVYRSANPSGPFTRLTTESTAIPHLEVIDHFPGLNYMVRAVELVESPSGSYYAASTGVMWIDSNLPPPIPKPGEIMSKAKFIEADTTTQGNWSEKYGQEGRILAYGVKNEPAYARVSPNGSTEFQWSDSTEDVRALQRIGMSRLAAVWVAPIGFSVDIKSDALPHRLALYFLDWDKKGRQQGVEIRDGATDALLVLSSLVDFQNGVWLVYDFQGSIKIRITNRRSGVTNCVLSGIFFGPAGPTPEPVPNMLTIDVLAQTKVDGEWRLAYTFDIDATGTEHAIFKLAIRNSTS